ncbi:hypothetical protein C4564_00335 [Candidatus Microgenomates bacterium]|nr:MAG: hypothetical protein C4564_00335 [Candidatus Microgenomates bacterium]
MGYAKTERGQALLLVLLAMVTLTTLVLSIVARSISEVTITTNEEDSLRAFSAAEAGVEKALITGNSITDNLSVPGPSGEETIAQFTAGVDAYPLNSKDYVYPFELLSGQGASVWLVTRDGNDILSCATSPCYTGRSIRMCWGNPGTNRNQPSTPAMQVSVVYEDGSGNLKIATAAYDPNVGRASANSFSTASATACTIENSTFAFQAVIDLQAMGLPWSTAGRMKLMRVKPLYNTGVGHRFAVTANGIAGTSNIPPQARKVDSTGTAGDSSRRVQAYLLPPEIPEIFDSAVFSPIDITK